MKKQLVDWILSVAMVLSLLALVAWLDTPTFG